MIRIGEIICRHQIRVAAQGPISCREITIFATVTYRGDEATSGGCRLLLLGLDKGYGGFDRVSPQNFVSKSCFGG